MKYVSSIIDDRSGTALKETISEQKELPFPALQSPVETCIGVCRKTTIDDINQIMHSTN